MMRIFIIICFLWILTPNSESRAESLVESRSLMPVGAYYYPEQWDESQWERDLKTMAELGFEFTHLAEFAWSRLEPEEGVFDFTWLDKCVELAQKYGLKVILCTPSPTPPAWLTCKHPEILIKTEDGFLVKHGMRLNCNGNNPIYQKYIARIIERLARRYGNHPAVCGWQIDNEPHYEGFYDYSDFAQEDFRRWLKRKYGNIESLNRAWGASFWSYTFNDFEQISIPNSKERTANPHAYIDFERYTADAVASALRFQEQILRKYVSSRQWITTNYAYYKLVPSVDPFRSKDFLDFASHTMYPLNTYLNYSDGPLAYRLGSGMELSFSVELARSVTGRTAIMELQPGQINWGAWNSQPLPGAVRMWIWHCFGLGDRFVCTYRYRQPLFGGEQFHKGIMEPDGVTLSPGGKEYVQAIREIRNLPHRECERPASVASRQTAFLWKHDNMFSMRHTQVRQDWDTWNYYYIYYQKLKTMGVPVDFVEEADSFDVHKYPFMVAPAYEMVDSGLIKRWKQYVQSGGNLVLTLRCGMKDNNSHLWESLLQEPLWQLIGAQVKGFDQLPRTVLGQLSVLGKNYTWNLWGDLLTPMPGTEVWGTYADQFYAGQPCVVYRKCGKGSVCYVGVASDNHEMEEYVLRKFYTEAGADILDLPDYVFTEYRDGYWITVNYTSDTIAAPISEKASLVLGDKRVPPAGVVVWSE